MLKFQYDDEKEINPLTILDPIVCAKFEVSQSKPMVNPHEHVEKLVREQIMAEVHRELKKKHDEIFGRFRNNKNKSKAHR